MGVLVSQVATAGSRCLLSRIFIIEGLLTFLLSCGLYPWIVDLPTTSKFLTPAERTAVVVRLKDDGDHMPHDFQFAYIKAAILDWKVWCMMLLELGSLTSVLAFGNVSLRVSPHSPVLSESSLHQKRSRKGISRLHFALKPRSLPQQSSTPWASRLVALSYWWFLPTPSA